LHAGQLHGTPDSTSLQLIHFIKRIMARSRRAVDPVTSGMEEGIKLLDRAVSVFRQEREKTRRLSEKVTKLNNEEQEFGTKAQDHERKAKELRIEEAKKKEERAGAESELEESEEYVARVKEKLQDIEAIMA